MSPRAGGGVGVFAEFPPLAPTDAETPATFFSLELLIIVSLAPAALDLGGSRGLDTGSGMGDLVAARLGGTTLVFATIPESSMLSVGRMGLGVEPRRGTGTSLFRALVGAPGCLDAIGFDTCTLAVTWLEAFAAIADLATLVPGREVPGCPGCLGCTAVAFPATVVVTFALDLLERVGLGTGPPGCLAMPGLAEEAYLEVGGCFDMGSFEATVAPFLAFTYDDGGGALGAAALAEAAAAAAALSFSRCFLCR